ncbi:MAG: OmpA family protein [Weeksellaceae bacterium]
MKKKFLLCLTFILCISFSFAQSSGDPYNINGRKYEKFTNDQKHFNDWYISLFGGINALQSSDLISFRLFADGEKFFTPGYDLSLGVTKEVTHAVGLSLMGQYGKTSQKGALRNNYLDFPAGTWVEAKTQYFGFSFMGDLNLSMLFRRIDNNSKFNWAWHAYVGAGFLGYEIDRRMNPVNGEPTPWAAVNDVSMNDMSFYGQIGTGLRHKLSKHFDLEMRLMYVLSGDESFDGSGEYSNNATGWTLPSNKPDHDDNMFTLSLGLHWKIGRHDESLQWYDPLKRSTIAAVGAEMTPCPDEDGDGVCDLYDKCPQTPEGLAVDGAGCPLDTDRDGVPDSIDECPTIPGPPTNNGCPLPVVEVSIGSIATVLSDAIQGIEFDYDSDVIRTVSYTKLDAAVNILEAHPTYRFYVEGHTDAAGSVVYNQGLSERRATSVVRYLVNKGIPASQLVPVGKGKTDLKWPECDPTSNCPAWKNLENRRVIFKPFGEAVEGLEYQQ